MTEAPAKPTGEFSREELAKELEHDYSTGRIGSVPLGKRRSSYHFLALWITLVAGFTYLFLGFQFHDAGYSLWWAVGAGALGGAAYLAYALPAAYLGSRTGQTYSLLSRSIFGKVGSVLVSLLLFGVAAGWAAFAFNLLAVMYDGLFGWGHVVLISVILAVVGIFNNLFGFTGITAFARYLVAPDHDRLDPLSGDQGVHRPAGGHPEFLPGRRHHAVVPVRSQHRDWLGYVGE